MPRPSPRAAGALLLFALALPTAGLGGEPPLQALARDTVGADQGVYVEAEDGTVLVSQLADRPVHPASVTKVATSLALLERLGPDHRFQTRFLADGSVRGGRLDGNLVVESGRDPFLVYESAFLVLERLHETGLRQVEGDLRVQGPLLFNWQPDPDGRRLRRALAGQQGAEAWDLVRARSAAAPATLRSAALAFGQNGTHRANGAPTALVTYRSPPLLHLVKVLNGYSNNVFHLVCEVIGGPPAVQDVARSHVPAAMQDEILITNGAGAGTTNRVSPRAVVALLRALERGLAKHHRTLADALPVSGVDPGTLEHRLLEHRATVIGKTGTFGSVGASALAGVLHTQRYGTVGFAVLNSWVPVPEARRRQDAFVRALIAATGATPWPYTAAVRPDYGAAQID